METRTEQKMEALRKLGRLVSELENFVDFLEIVGIKEDNGYINFSGKFGKTLSDLRGHIVSYDEELKLEANK